ncbi:hypothetical protein [Streptomyces fradiae]|uniref:hypothetical protein n=1 Tax=Streptomyces fradiae TaxID=1906 RepID=UPI003514F8F4
MAAGRGRGSGGIRWRGRRPATGHARLRGGARKPAALRRAGPHLAAAGGSRARTPAALGRTGQHVTTARPAARLRRRGRRTATGHAGLRGGARTRTALATGRRRRQHLPRPRNRPHRTRR